jgi:general secretion pathway protein F
MIASSCRVRAIDSNGELIEFALSVADPAVVGEELKQRRARLLSMKREFALPRFSALGRRASVETELFGRELSSLLKAGLTIPESISLLQDKEADPGFKQVLARLLRRLQEGDRLSVALAKEGDRFPSLLVAMTRASEDAASLSAGLDRYLRYSTLSQTLRRKAVVAMIYPALLVAVAFAVTIFLAVFVVPRFAVVFEDGAQPVPAVTALLLSASRVLTRYGLELGLAAAAAVVLTIVGWQKGAIRLPTRWIESAPIVGARLHVARVSRMLMALAALLEAGVPLTQALDLAKQVLPASWNGRIDATRASVEQGFLLSDSLSRANASTLVADRLLRVGERSGDLAGMAAQAARHHEEELERFIDRFMRVAEPLLMALIGLVIGAVVIALYLPLFDMAQWIR